MLIIVTMYRNYFENNSTKVMEIPGINMKIVSNTNITLTDEKEIKHTNIGFGFTLSICILHTYIQFLLP